MAKKTWFLSLLKNLFICESQSKAHKAQTKGWKWFLEKFTLKQLPTSTIQDKSLSEAKEEQIKLALNVAKATAAAADAAMAAAQAAVEVVRLTGISRSCLQQPKNEVWNLAAIKIQTVFRGYLAKKALRALKGVVRIQALARGRAVRRQLSKELKHSQLIHRSLLIHSLQVHRKNHSQSCDIGDTYQSPRMYNELVERSKLECKSQRQWTGNLFSKGELKSLYLKKHEAAFRRDRMRQYSFSHRERQISQMVGETVPLQHQERHTSIRKKWAEENTTLDFQSSTRISDFGGNLRIKPRNLFKEDFSEEVSSPSSYPRRSFCQMRQKACLDHDYQLTSPLSYPTYMAATESAKAKMRSMSTPRQRAGYINACFEDESPYKSDGPCQWSSSNSGSASKTTSALW